jgi:cyclic-di-GMP-binding biofilm dispersal mediator protein
VVGASGALGSRIAQQLTDRGAHLLLVGRDAERLRATGLSGEVVVGDLTDAGLGEAVAAAATSAHGRLDGVVNAAGVVAFGSLLDTADEVLEHLFLVNAIGPLWLLRRVQPLLAESGGFLAQVSAVVADQPQPGMVAYSASKAALAAADSALLRELRRVGISVHDLRPPHTETGLATRPLAGAAPRLPEGLDPDVVAARVVVAIEQGEAVVTAEDF